MKYLLFIIIFFKLFGCNNPSKKSIIEPLNLNELKELKQKYALFEDIYRRIETNRENHLKKDIDKLKWSELTYDRVYEFSYFAIELYRDSSQIEKFKNNWATIYGDVYMKFLNKGDSIMKEWEQLNLEWSEYLTEKEKIKKKSDELDYKIISDKEKLYQLEKIISEMDLQKIKFDEIQKSFNSFPESAKFYVDNKYTSPKAAEYKVINDLITNDYICMEDYVRQQQFKILRDQDSLSFEFFQLTGEE